MPSIIPSIFVPDEATFLSQVNAVIGTVDTVQLDIADGVFVAATTWADPEVVQTISPDIKIELHLMTEHPLEEMKRWQGVEHVKRVLFPYEARDDLELCIEACMESGWHPSMVLNPETPVDVLAPYADHLFGCMLMGIHPGAQGQTYLPETTKRLQEVHEKFPHLFLELDGGVNMTTLEEIVPTNLDAVCPGSAIFGTGEPAENVAGMRLQIQALAGE
jgi:ribulose-phosphate 3-epimerase